MSCCYVPSSEQVRFELAVFCWMIASRGSAGRFRCRPKRHWSRRATRLADGFNGTF
jgi:hypothetical protein